MQDKSLFVITLLCGCLVSHFTIVPVRAEQRVNKQWQTDSSLISNKTWLDRYGGKTTWKQKDQEQKTESTQETQTVLSIYNLVTGEKYSVRRGIKSSPKLADASLTFNQGIAVVPINKERTRTQSSMVASTAEDLHILGIYGVTADSTVISRTLDTIKVYSAGASDTTVARIMLMVQ